MTRNTTSGSTMLPDTLKILKTVRRYPDGVDTQTLIHALQIGNIPQTLRNLKDGGHIVNTSTLKNANANWMCKQVFRARQAAEPQGASQLQKGWSSGPALRATAPGSYQPKGNYMGEGLEKFDGRPDAMDAFDLPSLQNGERVQPSSIKTGCSGRPLGGLAGGRSQRFSA